jgi:hypothetical protein
MGKNPRSWAAWGIAAVAVLIWPWLLTMGLLQWVFAVPLLVVFAIHGTDISKLLSAGALALALGSGLTLFAVVCVIAYYQTRAMAH